MKVRFYCYADESDVYEVDENITVQELIDAACDWVCDNANVSYEIIEDLEDEGTIE